MAPMPRRRLLKTLSFLPLAASTLLGSGCASEASRQFGADTDSPASARLRVFSGEQAGILACMTEACLDRPYAEVAVAEVIERLDEEVFFVSASIRDDFLLALTVLEYLPFVYLRFSRFSRMTRADRVAFLEARMDTDSESIRAVVNSLRMAIMMVYYGHESTWESVSYDGPFAGVEPLMSAQRKYYRQGLNDAAGGTTNGGPTS